MISQEGIAPDIQYCRDGVMQHDYDRYVLSMGAAAKYRQALWAVMAFQYEIAKTRDVARGMAGHVRLTWWRDAILSGAKSHEVLRALQCFELPQDLLLEIIDARRADIDNTPPDDLSVRALQLNAPLLKLCAHIMGYQGDVRHLAIAYGLVGALRALPHAIAGGQVILPRDVLARLGVDAAQMAHIKPSEVLNDFVRDAALNAQVHLDLARPYEDAFFKAVGAMCALYIKRMGRYGYDVFVPAFSAPIPFLGIRVLLKSKTL